MAIKILICDDEPVVHESLHIYFEAEGYEVIDAYDGEEGLSKIDSSVSLCILDIMMPKKSGIDVCREIRKDSTLPIVMLTAKGEEIDRILGLELGADDYIVKPFSPREVVARVKAILRRVETKEQTKDSNIITYNGLTIDLNSYTVTLRGEHVICTPKEIEILYNPENPEAITSPGKTSSIIIIIVGLCAFFGPLVLKVLTYTSARPVC